MERCGVGCVDEPTITAPIEQPINRWRADQRRWRTETAAVGQFSNLIPRQWQSTRRSPEAMMHSRHWATARAGHIS